MLKYPGGHRGGMSVVRYQDQVLDKVLHDFYQEMAEERGQVLFQQDGAPLHTTKSTLMWLDSNAIKWMPHPSGSPDLNPIEPLWHTFKELICNHEHIPTTVDKLKVMAIEAWDQITVVDIDNMSIKWRIMFGQC